MNYLIKSVHFDLRYLPVGKRKTNKGNRCCTCLQLVQSKSSKITSSLRSNYKEKAKKFDDVISVADGTIKFDSPQAKMIILKYNSIQPSFLTVPGNMLQTTHES
jgi:hypothetical protein